MEDQGITKASRVYVLGIMNVRIKLCANPSGRCIDTSLDR